MPPFSRTSATSSGPSMLPSSSMVLPSIVDAGFVASRCSFARSMPSASWRSRYSESTAGSGLTMTTPRVPSMISWSFSRISARARCSATMAGMFRLRATIAVCEVDPPRSVRNPAKGNCLNWIMSAGDRSCATRIARALPGSSRGM